jgi:hypothetical protein
LTELLGLLYPSETVEHTAMLCNSSIRATLDCHQSCPFLVVILTSVAFGLLSGQPDRKRNFDDVAKN